MEQKKAVRNFLQGAIEHLSKEDFDELVRIFQLSYWQNTEVVNVDGANDGGTDIKVYQNKKEQRKCIQITVQKTGLLLKLKKDLEKVRKKISQYNYPNRLEFYCSASVSDESIEEYKKMALQEFDIVLEVYEAKRLAQLDCKDAVEYVYSLHSDVVLKPEQMNIDKATKTLYDLLANGKDSSNIKNSIVDSVIISILYEKAPIGISELKAELENRLGKGVPDIQHSVNSLKSDQRIIKDAENPKLIRLSELEFSNVKEILANSEKEEKDFCVALANILKKYEIDYSEDIYNELRILYKSNYSQDLDDSTKKDDSAYLTAFETFKKKLSNQLNDEKNVELLICEIKELCSTNNYLNKASASESFLSLYKSNRLEQYLNHKHKDVYLDTPTFVYLLCDYYGIEKNDWDNPFYRSMKGLIRLKESYQDKISLYITQNYLGEVIGEIKKALIISQFENYPFFKDMGGTSNTLFNYYLFLKEANLFEEEDEINCFADFIFSLGLDNTDTNDVRFYKDTNSFLHQVANDFDIEVVSWSQNEKYTEFKVLYEKVLLASEKNKSETAIRNDVNQVIESLKHDRDTDCYFTTWDTTIHLLRDKILKEDDQLEYKYFNICNPARLSNKIALENFNINESALTNDIFAYADKRYDISNRVKSLLELIAPFLRDKGTGSKKLFKRLGRLRKGQLEQMGDEIGTERDEKNLPIEEVFMLLIPSEEKRKQDNTIMSKFSTFMSSEANTEYIINIIENVSKLKDYKAFDLSEYFKRIESVDLSV